MTAPTTPEPTTPPESTSTPPSTGNGQPAAPPEPYRFGENSPSWAKGKTAEEILGLVELQNQTIQQMQAQRPQVQAEQPRAQNGQWVAGIGDEDFITGGQVKQLVERIQQANAPTSQYAQMALESAAGLAIGVAQSKPENKKVFERYGPEVNAMLAKLTPEYRTLDNIQYVVDLVKGRHVEDLAQIRAQELLAQTSPTMRSLGGAGLAGTPNQTPQPVGPLEDERIPLEIRNSWKGTGLTNRQLEEFAAANGQTMEQFVKVYGKTAFGGGK